MPYEPPVTTNLPFNFTNSGYSAPNSKELLFNFSEPGRFGDLRAAVTVMQAPDYLTQTYSYVKSCPSYVIGYSPGGVQILRGRCLYGGIRDLRASLTVVVPEFEHADLSASIGGVDSRDLSAAIDTHSPANLAAAVRVFQADTKDLSATLSVRHIADLQAILEGIHDPGNLVASVFAKRRSLDSLLATIRGWGASDLTANVRAMHPIDLPTSITAVPPSDLPAYLKVWPQDVLPASVYGWGSLDLTAYLDVIFADDLPAQIVGRDDMFANLRARIKGYGSPYIDLSAYLQTFHISDLTAIIRAKYFEDLSAYLFPVLPKYLSAFLRAWHIKNLSAEIVGTKYPWELSASITATGAWASLTARISSITQAVIGRNLPTTLMAWQSTSLSARIVANASPYLSAYLNPQGYASDLHASLYPKVIRLTTLINISTLAHKDLSAVINSFCIHTGYSTLLASLSIKYKSDLFAFVRAVVYDYKPTTLSAKVGYADSYLELDTITLNFTLSPSSFYTLDKYKLVINLYSAGNNLSAYIRGTLRYTDLAAQATAVAIDSYTFSSFFKNRELVVHKTYDGVFQSSEVVEMAFSSAVEDYYYSSDGDYAWKKDRLERWMLSVKSMLPTNTALRLKRRLHRAATVYDLRKFVSVDEALRFAIAYVTEYPQANLSAQIVNRGKFELLGGILNVRHVQSKRSSLSSSVTPVGHTVILGTEQNISRI